MTRALITGGAGFIGAHLARLLNDHGYCVDLADNFSRGLYDAELRLLSSRPGIRLRHMDLRRPEEVDRLDDDYRYIYHLAAIVGVARVITRAYQVMSDNVGMLLNVLALAGRQKALQRFVFASTSEVYAGTLQHFTLPIPTPESVPLALPDLEEPRTSYMLSKIYGECLCLHAGIPITIIRPHNVYGPRMGMAHVIPELLKKAYYMPDGGPLEVWSPDHCRTFCYVDDAVNMAKAAAESVAAVGRVLNIGQSGPEISMRGVARIVLEVTGRDLQIAECPETQGSPQRRLPDLTKIIALTGYRPQIDLKDGITRTYGWYRSYVFEPGKYCVA